MTREQPCTVITCRAWPPTGATSTVRFFGLHVLVLYLCVNRDPVIDHGTTRGSRCTRSRVLVSSRMVRSPPKVLRGFSRKLHRSSVLSRGNPHAQCFARFLAVFFGNHLPWFPGRIPTGTHDLPRCPEAVPTVFHHPSAISRGNQHGCPRSSAVIPTGTRCELSTKSRNCHGFWPGGHPTTTKKWRPRRGRSTWRSFEDH